MTRRRRPDLGDIRFRGSMREGGVLILPDGKQVQVRKLGKGHHSVAMVEVVQGRLVKGKWQAPKREPRVYLFTSEDDFAKDILSDIETRNRHIPRVTKLGWLVGSGKPRTVYEMPLYRAPLRKSNSATAWRQAKTLQRCLEEAHANNRRQYPSHQWIWNGYKMQQEVIACARKAKVPGSLVNALKLLSDAASNYGSTWAFEFPIRNMATDAKGYLILFDVLFDMEVIEKQRRAAAPPRWR